MIPVRGLFETHLTLRDVKRSADFYHTVVGLTIAYPKAAIGHMSYSPWLARAG